MVAAGVVGPEVVVAGAVAAGASAAGVLAPGGATPGRGLRLRDAAQLVLIRHREYLGL